MKVVYGKMRGNYVEIIGEGGENLSQHFYRLGVFLTSHAK